MAQWVIAFISKRQCWSTTPNRNKPIYQKLDDAGNSAPMMTVASVAGSITEFFLSEQPAERAEILNELLEEEEGT